MTAFLKDFLAFIALGGFTVTALTWMDVASQLV